MALLDRILRAGEGKKVKALADIIPDINAQEPEIHALSDQALKGKTAEFRSRIERGEDTDDLLVEACMQDGFPRCARAKVRRLFQLCLCISMHCPVKVCTW
jgi:preprotein translocase subunit SecA